MRGKDNWILKEIRDAEVSRENNRLEQTPSEDNGESSFDSGHQSHGQTMPGAGRGNPRVRAHEQAPVNQNVSSRGRGGAQGPVNQNGNDVIPYMESRHTQTQGSYKRSTGVQTMRSVASVATQFNEDDFKIRRSSRAKKSTKFYEA